MTWKYFIGDLAEATPLTSLPERPPWREFLPVNSVNEDIDRSYWERLRAIAELDMRSQQRGQSFKIKLEDGYSKVIDAVNAAIHLRRPLLVTGVPGSGKTSLAYAIATELNLGPVLVWPITAKSNLTDALYQYDAIARLQDAQLDKTREGDVGKPREEGQLGDYIQLGPLGTAFLPSRLPRVLLIDEIDKSDLNLPNDLLNLFEEGEFEIPELVRRKRSQTSYLEDSEVPIRTLEDIEKNVVNGRIKCCEFPITLMTSNGEREFPPAFHRRCLRVKMPDPSPKSLFPIVRAHFENADENGWTQNEDKLKELIEEFCEAGRKADRATDQLLNAIYLMTREESPNETEMDRLKELLFKRLSETD